MTACFVLENPDSYKAKPQESLNHQQNHYNIICQ